MHSGENLRFIFRDYYLHDKFLPGEKCNRYRIFEEARLSQLDYNLYTLTKRPYQNNESEDGLKNKRKPVE